MFTTLFYYSFSALILAELIKGLSANGTPPLRQKYSWQLDLAYFMWSKILYFRLLFIVLMAYCLFSMTGQEQASVVPFSITLVLVWGFVYWLFNLFWVGKHKFDPLKQINFAKADQNTVALEEQVMGVNWNGEQKAYPVSMLFYHHQVSDHIANHPIWITYCGLCRSGRVYDILVDGEALDFVTGGQALVGAVTFNAIFRDYKTQTWWRQETGEAAKGELAGKVLQDIPMEQMSLKHWLEKHPDSAILQYDPSYQKKYDFVSGLLKYELSLPGWHFQKRPPLIIGVELEGQEIAYDWNQLQKKRLVQDQLGDNALLVLSSEDGSSSYTYLRTLKGEVLDFEISGDILTDTKTKSTWNLFGQCVDGALKGEELTSVQYYKQFIRAWLSFHPNSSFYKF